MSWVGKKLTAEDYRRRSQDSSMLAGAIDIAIFLVPFILLFRMAVFISAAPGHLTGDGSFSIADVLSGP